MRDWLHYPQDMRNAPGYFITGMIVVTILMSLFLDIVGYSKLLF